MDTLGLVLAGGLSRRMGGGDKGLRLLDGRPILRHVIERLRPQCGALLLNANGDPARLAALGLPVVPDGVPDHPGPLAGVLAGLDAAAARGFGWVVSVPGDTPFLPADLVARLHGARGTAPMTIASSGGRDHPVVALWPVSARFRVRDTLAMAMRRVGGATAGAARATWPDQPFDPFLNVNTPDDLEAAEALAATI